ncbi:MAG: hypothetical protein AAFU60_00435 [Bacteroidota bacterium]
MNKLLLTLCCLSWGPWLMGQNTLSLSNGYFSLDFPASWGTIEEKIQQADRYQTPFVQEAVIETPVLANAKMEALKVYMAWLEDEVSMEELSVNGRAVYRVAKVMDKSYQFYFFKLSEKAVGLLKLTVNADQYSTFSAEYNQVLQSLTFQPRDPMQPLLQENTPQEVLALVDTFPRRGINGLDYLVGGMLRGIVEIQIADGPLITDFEEWQRWKLESPLADSLVFTTFSAGLRELCQYHLHLGDYKKMKITQPTANQLAFTFWGNKRPKVTLWWKFEGEHSFPLNRTKKVERFLFNTDFATYLANREPGYLAPFLINDQTYQLKGRLLGIQ